MSGFSFLLAFYQGLATCTPDIRKELTINQILHKLKNEMFTAETRGAVR